MKVYIDADACPVTNIAVELCRKYHTMCYIFCDTAHAIFRDGADTIIVDQGADSTDYAITARVMPNDLVITQDYGLASMVLAKKARALHQNGWEYTADNIGALLFERHASAKFRRGGGRIKGPSKRTAEQDQHFRYALEAMLQNAFQG